MFNINITKMKYLHSDLTKLYGEILEMYARLLSPLECFTPFLYPHRDNGNKVRRMKRCHQRLRAKALKGRSTHLSSFLGSCKNLHGIPSPWEGNEVCIFRLKPQENFFMLFNRQSKWNLLAVCREKVLFYTIFKFQI